jgi:pyruvate/2-oxoacid:ferredoxin oxidoreductase alpha subunit
MTEVRALEGNEAVARVAYAVSEICSIYPITPSSPMAEMADVWSASGKPNIWGQVPDIIEMQSEGGAAGTAHGALQTGALTTTFTASQGLMLMLPNMYKIAGELTSAVFHVASRSLAAQALSIFGDHQDVMAARTTGFGLLAASSVQAAQDLALISHAATLEARLPFIHFFDGFRTSHEVSKIELVSEEQMHAMMDDDLIYQHRNRALNPDNPFIRGTAQNPDVYFQGRETVNPYYNATPGIVQKTMDRFGEITGRHYGLFDYHGDPNAERAIILMGSGADTVMHTIDALHPQGVGVLNVRLYRPFSAEHLLAALPDSVRTIAVLDRTKEAGASGEPLYQDVVTALAEAVGNGARKSMPRVIGGRYGLSSNRPEATLHGRHTRRRDPHESGLRPCDAHRERECDARRLLWHGFRRHRGREQEQHQDYRRKHGPLGPGLLRLRLEKIRVANDLAPALRARADPCALPDPERQLHRVPQIRTRQQDRVAHQRLRRRRLPAQQPLPGRRGMGPAAAPRAGNYHRPRHSPVRRPAARRSNCADQGGHREDLQVEGPVGHRQELRCRRCRARPPARSRDPGEPAQRT